MVLRLFDVFVVYSYIKLLSTFFLFVLLKSDNSFCHKTVHIILSAPIICEMPSYVHVCKQMILFIVGHLFLYCGLE